jgi:anti-sigma regulatory factor (Ser/Thr protein kinase)
MVTDNSHFPANRLAPTFARARLAAFLGSDVPEIFTAEAPLLTSELVTNSVIHSCLTELDEITLDLDLDDTRLVRSRDRRARTI